MIHDLNYKLFLTYNNIACNIDYITIKIVVFSFKFFKKKTEKEVLDFIFDCLIRVNINNTLVNQFIKFGIMSRIRS